MRNGAAHILVILVAISGVIADVVELKNGDRIECRVVGGTANLIYIRRAPGAGGTLEKIDRAQLRKIERDKHGAESRPTEGGAELRGATSQKNDMQKAAASQPTGSAAGVEIDAKMQRSLAMAIAKWRGEDLREAGVDLARLINRSTPALREAMSEQVRDLIGMTLPELAADVHWRAAQNSRRGSAIRLEYVTEYEKPALIARMSLAYEAALRSRDETSLEGGSESVSGAKPRPQPVPVSTTHEVGANGEGEVPRRHTTVGKTGTQPWYESLPPSSQPGGLDPQDRGNDYAIIDLLGRPERFKGSTAQAKVLAARTAYAMSILNERLRLDSGVKRNDELRRQLLWDKQRLATLSKMLSARIAHPPRGEPDQRVVEAERIRREEYRKKWEEQQKAQTDELHQVQEAARKWQAEQDKQSVGKPGWFDWLKPKSADEKK